MNLHQLLVLVLLSANSPVLQVGDGGHECDAVFPEPAVIPGAPICGCRNVGVPKIAATHVRPQDKKQFFNPKAAGHLPQVGLVSSESFMLLSYFI